MLSLCRRATGPAQLRHAVGKQLALPSTAQGTKWAGTGLVAMSGSLEHRLVTRGVAGSSQRRSYVQADTVVSSTMAHRPMDEALKYYLNPAHFFALLKFHGTTFFAGVPDSFLKDFCTYITDTVDKKDHIVAANEGTAMSLAACHHWATGKIACVYLQNPESFSTANPPLSLVSPKVDSTPTLMLIGWRGESGDKDGPQPEDSVTPELLREMDIPFDILPDNAEGAFKVLDKAYKHMKAQKGPYAMLVRSETFGKRQLASE